jgi:ABC-type nitrate/sulfonate/bicarbonate transport system substrate-binding protein
MRKFGPIALLAGLVCLLGASTPVTQTAPLDFGFWTSGQSGLLGLVLQDRQMFEAEGLAVNYYRFPRIDGSIRAFQTKALTLSLQNPVAVARMHEEGNDVVVLATFNLADTRFVVPKDSPIHSLADLKNKKLGTSGIGTTADALATAVLQYRYSLGDNDVQKVAAQESQLIAYLDNKQIDVALMRAITFDRSPNRKNYRIIATLQGEWSKYTKAPGAALIGLVVTHASYLSANPQAVDRAMVALLKASRYGARNAGPLATIVAGEFNIDNDAAADLASSWKDTIKVDLDANTIASLNREFDVFAKLGLIQKAPDASIIDDQPFRHALALGAPKP